MTPKAEETLLALHQLLEEMVHVRAQLRAHELAASGLPDSMMTSESLAIRLSMLGVLQEHGWVPPQQGYQARRELDETLRLLRGVLNGDADSLQHAKRRLGIDESNAPRQQADAPPSGEAHEPLKPWSRW